MYCLLHRASYFQMEKIWKKKLVRLKKWRVHRDPRATLDKEEVIGIRALQ